MDISASTAAWDRDGRHLRDSVQQCESCRLTKSYRTFLAANRVASACGSSTYTLLPCHNHFEPFLTHRLTHSNPVSVLCHLTVCSPVGVRDVPYPRLLLRSRERGAAQAHTTVNLQMNELLRMAPHLWHSRSLLVPKCFYRVSRKPPK
jgi:hypothetical protein